MSASFWIRAGMSIVLVNGEQDSTRLVSIEAGGSDRKRLRRLCRRGGLIHPTKMLRISARTPAILGRSTP